MAIGKVNTPLGAMSPNTDGAVLIVDENARSPALDLRMMSHAPDTSGAQREHSGHEPPSEVVRQLQVMISAVRILNDIASEQGASVVLSSSGLHLRNAVTGLGHLLSSADPRVLNGEAATQVHEAGKIIGAVEIGLENTQKATDQVVRTLPALQALRAQDAASLFQKEMRQAVYRVKDALANTRKPAES